jgi:subtilase family serine protease
VIPGVAAASPRARVTMDARAPGAPATAAVCSAGSGANHCHAHVRMTPAGEIQASAAPAAAPDGYGPADLQSAYQIDPSKAKPATVAIVDAYGYANLESDLATYRAQYGLPPCTRANGCLKIVNQNGATSPLPGEPPPDDDWTVETALDVDMASAACPKCKILVVQSDDTNSVNLYTAQNSAAAAHVTVISDSWGRPQSVGEDLTQHEPYFDHPGIAQFFSAGDSGYDEGGRGPSYPSTSAHVIGVGGTTLTRSGNARGWSETAWMMGGSSCSYSIPKPSFQTASPCTFRAASDISAVGDPATGVAIYNNGSWMVIGGTSAAAPIVAGIFASTGHGNATAAMIAQSTSALYDVTSGSNGSCPTSQWCTARVGWDGPTGLGTPNGTGAF